MAGPDLPPRSSESSESTRSLPFCLVAPWHLAQRSARMWLAEVAPTGVAPAGGAIAGSGVALGVASSSDFAAAAGSRGEGSAGALLAGEAAAVPSDATAV